MDNDSVAHGADLSWWAMFAEATLVVQLVMLLLVAASLWSWAIIAQKLKDYRAARAKADSFDEAFWSGEPLEALYEEVGETPSTAPERVFAAGMTEWRRSHRKTGGLIAGAGSRIDRSMDVAIQKEEERLRAGLPLLATVGSTAPFVGLFGTVIGIMNSFIQIAAQQNTNLAVVAPGIAEALFATGLGLLAAIPAVIFYNKLSSDADRIVGHLEGFADEFSTILSRQLDAA